MTRHAIALFCLLHRNSLCVVAMMVVLASSVQIGPSYGEENGFKSLFNGKDLSGWDGNPELWSVEDGCITGRTTGPEHLAYNQFLIWREGLVRNFELRAKIRVSASNSGIQYRSREFPGAGKWSVGGYQCDIHSTALNNGMVYGEKWGGILVQNGQSVVIDPAGRKWLVAEHDPVKVDIADWHEYTIIAQGNHLVHKIDGQVTIDLLDFGTKTQLLEGIIAFQLHRGPAMTLQVKDVRMKELPDGGVVTFDSSKVPVHAKPVDKANPDKNQKAKTSSQILTPPASNTNSTSQWKWLWTDSTADKQAARLKKEFELGDALVKEAVLRVSCDNGAEVFLNGERVLTNPDWQRPSQADVTRQLRRGRNELRAEATNKGNVAGFLAVLSIKLEDGSERSLFTDASWLAAPPGSDDWKPATVVNSYGNKPYGEIFNTSVQRPTTTTSDEVISPESIKTLPGFKVEMIHKVIKGSEGSWVGLTVDSQGRIIATDQYGGLFRLTPPPIGSSSQAHVEKLDIEINGAHGLLYAFDSLYVLVNEKPNVAGLYRLRDTNGNDQFDEKLLLREIKGQGEHGNHSLALSPDGQSIFIACGNGTAQPQIEHTRGSRPFADDQVVPRTSKGAEFSDTEPQAFTCKVSPDGKRVEMVAAGLRNHFDIAFNALGDLFTYDSDMEWDAGTPWYRPTRIYHLVSGGDYGFRESSGKLLSYCPDVVPPLVEVGPGSPTGVVSGLGAAFPAKYQHAIYACDWTYGTLYAIHLSPKGASYDATLEEFVYGKPLPLTDVVIGKDGAMYFAIGGRRTQSAVFRVTYQGEESVALAKAPTPTPEHKLRFELERLHEEGVGPEAIDKAWPHLGHEDRFVRYAARVAIERQPAKFWAARALKQTEPWAVIESGVALARLGGKENQAALMEMLNAIDFEKLDVAQQLATVRAYQISVARDGLPDGAALTNAVSRLDAEFPSTRNDLNRELSRTLAALGSAEVVGKTLELMRTAKDDPVSWLSVERMLRNDRYGPNFLRTGDARPNAQQIAYAYGLRFAKNGWTPEMRKVYFAWFAGTGVWQGGNQFRGFIDTIRDDALGSVPDIDERAKLAQLATPKMAIAVPSVIYPPKGPGKDYTVDEVTTLATKRLHNRSFKRGQELYIATSCQACHRLGNDGGGIGPDLTTAGNRYTLRDLVENIVDPSKVISNQYESTIFELENDTILVGRIVSEDENVVKVAANPTAPGKITEIKSNEILSRKPSPVSLMPSGLMNGMNPEEVADLLAYILSGADRKNAMFAP